MKLAWYQGSVVDRIHPHSPLTHTTHPPSQHDLSSIIFSGATKVSPGHQSHSLPLISSTTCQRESMKLLWVSYIISFPFQNSCWFVPMLVVYCSLAKQCPLAKQHPLAKEYPPPLLAQFPLWGQSLLKWALSSLMRDGTGHLSVHAGQSVLRKW